MRKFVIPFIVFVLITAFFPGKVLSSPPAPTLLEVLQQQTGGSIHINYHPETGMVSYIGTDPGKPIVQQNLLSPEDTPENAAIQFMASYGDLFGLENAWQDLKVAKTQRTEDGRTFVRFQQQYQGISVLGGEYVVQMDNSRNVISANGEGLPNPALDVTPTVAADTAKQKAIQAVASLYGVDASQLESIQPELWIYFPALLNGVGLQTGSLVWRIDVMPVEMLPFRELVLVDAHIGAIALHFNQVDSILNRVIYDNEDIPGLGLPGNLTCSEGTCSGSNTDDYFNAYVYAGATYNFYTTFHSRDSLDGAGMTLVSTVRYCPNSSLCPYPNAYWNGHQMVYGWGYASADDVVGHEMTHGVTENTSRLFYYYQSGAINEALSDIWGEFIDQTDGMGNDSANVRWLMGEDLPISAIRSMSNPPAFGDPDKMSSSNFSCDARDNGGVHINSGVANKAAFLMVDGGTFNGKTVTGLGITKTAKIFYEAQTHLLTSASDYRDLYNDLQQACNNLIASGITTGANCGQVKNALDAVEMNNLPSTCTAMDAPICDSGTPSNLFYDDMENTASGNWAHGTNSGTDYWFYPQNPNSFNFDATYATSGKTNVWGYDQPASSDTYFRMNRDVPLPSNATAYLHFKHAYMFDFASSTYTYKDGGVLEYSMDGGSSWFDAGVLPAFRGYNGAINSSSNPLNGRRAFAGESNGYVSSRFDLSRLAGRNVRFRFRMGTDSNGDHYGWFIDDVRVYTCAGAAPIKKIMLPIIKTNQSAPPQPAGLTPGYWKGPDQNELYVTADGKGVKNFAVVVSLNNCGTYKITHTIVEPISSNAFSFTGEFSASGIFDTVTALHGTASLNNIQIPGCGAKSVSPWQWTAVWQNSSQPAAAISTNSENAVGAVPADPSALVVHLK